MEDGTYREARSLSVIPYDNNRDIVLRHADSIVYLDPRTNQLIPFSRNQSVQPTSPRGDECPTCRRPWHSQTSAPSHNIGSDAPDDQPNFITNDYFQMLARSLPGSNQPSAPPSPRRRIAQPVRSQLASSLTVEPPVEAEFVGSSPAPPSATNGISETAFAPQYFEKFFTIERELGRGGRGVVLLVKHTLDGVHLGHFACKRVPIGDDHAWLEKVLVEVQLLQNLSHQNLVSYRHVWLEDYQMNAFSPTIPCAFILQQYCNGGDLHNYVCGAAQNTATAQQLKERIRRKSRGEAELPRKENEPKRLSFDEIYSFFKDITAGLRFLHLNGFIHRDLKPSNCLLHTIGTETQVLVSDFGEVQYQYAARNSTGATGTISYCAPEVLTRVVPGGPFGNFTFKSDIFSLGMILHFLCFANLPYLCANVLHEDREDVDKLRAEIVAWGGFDDQRKLRPELPAELYAFLKRLLSLNPDHRPSAEEVNHGISTGRLDAFPELRRRNSTSPEELTPGRRIQKLDTPVRGSSPQQGLGIGGQSRRPIYHNRSRSRERIHPSKLNLDTSGVDDPFDDRQNSDHNKDDQSGWSEQLSDVDAAADTNQLATSSSSIILHPTVSSTLPSPTAKSPIIHNSTPTYSSDPHHRQLLLPPPQPSTQHVFLPTRPLAIVTTLFNTRLHSSTLRASLLLLKLLSTLQPCTTTSTGLNPSIVYPLLTLAVAEFTLLPPRRYRLWMAAVGVVAHALILSWAISRGTLCRYSTDPKAGGGADIWRDSNVSWDGFDDGGGGGDENNGRS